MQKSEALGHLIDISDSKDRSFDTFLEQYKTLGLIIDEFPELSASALPIIIQTIRDPEFNSDIRPIAAKVFNAAVAQVDPHQVMETFDSLFAHKPSFAFYAVPETLKLRPELSETLFPKLLQETINGDANTRNARTAALKAAIVNAKSDQASEMLNEIFSLPDEHHLLCHRMYGALGQIYSVHPQLKEQIFELIEKGPRSTPELYGAFYSNLGQVALYDPTAFPRSVSLLKSHIQSSDNTPASLSQAYKSINEALLQNYPDQKELLEGIVKTGLQNPANNLASNKTAWRILGERDKLNSSISLGRRGEKNDENQFGWHNVQTIEAEEICVLVLGGDGVRTERAANGYMGSVYRLLEENNLQHKVNVYGAVYDFGEYMNTNDARNQLMEKHHRNIRLTRQIDPDSMDPKYIKKIFDAIILPRIMTNDTRMDADKAADNIRKLTVVAHCHGAYTALKLEELMQDKMTDLGYTKAEQSLIQKQLLVLAQSPYCPIGNSKSTFISFGSAEDEDVSHYNNFEKSLRLLNRQQPIPLSYFPEKQGNVFLVGSMGKNYDQHNFWGYSPSPEMGREGQALVALSAKILINGVKNSLDTTPRIPEVKDLAADDQLSQELFDKMTANGKDVYQKIVSQSIQLHRKQKIDRD